MSPGPPGTVGLVVHGGRASAREAAARAVDQLRAAGRRVVACRTDDWDQVAAEAHEIRPPERFAAGTDVVCALGGDGTFLRAAWLARDHGVPVLGINHGRMGFLAEVDSGEADAALARLCDGDWSIELRMTLAVRVLDAEGAVLRVGWALNEASIERTVPQHLVVLEVEVGATPLATLPADAVVCATPTGSTAYAFSAGGPILSPAVDALLLVPVAAHHLFQRSVVVDPAETVRVRPAASAHCVVTLDGRETLEVPAGGCVEVVRGDVPVRMVRIGGADFYARVRDKFGLR